MEKNICSQKILPSDRVVILVDNREMQSNATRYIREHDVDIRPINLEVGDFICSDRVCIERKTVRDFLQSIIDQRIFAQLENLNNSFERPVLIIEGNPELLFLERKMHANTVRGVLSSIAIDQRLPIIWTHNSRETSSQIYWMAYREQVKEKRGIQIRSSKKPKTLAQEQEYLVAGLPGINSVMSKRLLKTFKNPEGVFHASEKKLLEVDGFGEKRIKRMKGVLTEEYRG